MSGIWVESYLEVFNKVDINSLFPHGLKDTSLINTNNGKIFFWTNHRVNYPFRFISNSQGSGYFESVLNPQFRLRHKCGKMSMEPINKDDPQFLTDSTFQIEHGIDRLQGRKLSSSIFDVLIRLIFIYSVRIV